MFKNVLVCTLLLIFSGQTFAKNVVQRMLEEKKDATPFEILAGFYESGVSMNSDISFLNQYDFDTRKSEIHFNHCVVSYPNRLDLSDVNLTVVHHNKFIPGVPSHGPLFPGRPDQHLDQVGCALKPDLSGISLYWVEEILNQANFYPNGDQSVSCISMASNSTFIFETAGLTVKNYGDLVSFRTSLKDGDAYTQGYGYCWNE